MIGILITKTRKMHSSDDQVSVDRDSDDDIDGQDLDDQDFDERESINEDSDNNGQASASVGMDQELESSLREWF